MLTDDEVIAQALRILQSRLRNGPVMDSPCAVKEFLTLKLSGLEHEQFSIMFLDSQNYLIEFVDLFRGTLTQTSVYPREVVKLALQLNANGVIFAHNHPSGQPEPSRADEYLTTTLKSALQLIDVRVLDHIIVGGVSTVSFVERGLL